MTWDGDLLKAGIDSDGKNVDILDGNFTANNFPSMAHRTIYVDSNNGLDTYTGNSPDKAKATIQAAVDIANSAAYATKNVDILVLGVLYSENVNFSRAGTELTDAAMLWQAGGTNVGKIGKIRLIAVGYVWLAGALTVAQPTISISRPNVEIHNFSTIKCLVTDTDSIKKGNWTFAEGGTSVHMQMPVIGFDDNYNYNHDGAGGGTLLNGAANACLVNNCRINGGTGGGGILNNGGNWIYATNCLVEYFTEYGIGHVASSKGKPAENLIQNANFHQLNASATCIMHDAAVILWADQIRCWDEDPGGGGTAGLLQKRTGGTNAQFSWITNVYCHDTADLDGNNSGFMAAQVYSATDGGPQGCDLSGTTWRYGNALTA